MICQAKQDCWNSFIKVVIFDDINELTTTINSENRSTKIDDEEFRKNGSLFVVYQKTFGENFHGFFCFEFYGRTEPFCRNFWLRTKSELTIYWTYWWRGQTNERTKRCGQKSERCDFFFKMRIKKIMKQFFSYIYFEIKNCSG